MNEEDLLKKIQKLIREEVRPVKDLVEMTKKKVESHDLFITTTSGSVRTIGEQQSIINEKLDNHTESLVTIESTIKIYGENLHPNLP